MRSSSSFPTTSCRILFATVLLNVALAGCATDIGRPDSSCEDGSCDALSRRTDNAKRIRDSAAAAGMTNGALLAGIGEVETTLAHCWSEAQWACKGPNSSSCGNGPVIAGSGDGACSLKQGGLGMFQFDAGTYRQTLSREGRNILTLEGNVEAVVPFIVTRAIESVAGVNTRQQALDWMNAIRIKDGDQGYEDWLYFISWRYNGCKGCRKQQNKYRAGTHKMVSEMGESFWTSSNPDFDPRPDDVWIGTACEDQNTCDFEVSGQVAECLDWFDDDDDELYGFCSAACEGTCADLTGHPTSFCADIDGSGSCVAEPALPNGQCSQVPGTDLAVAARYIGSSGASMVHKGVCLPPGNELLCVTGDGSEGECIDTNSMDCDGSLISGRCPGGNNIRCCVP